MLRLDTTASVTTPERVRFEYPLAGPGPRAVAWVIDAGLRGAALVVLAVLVALISPTQALAEVGTGLMLVVLFVMEWFYGAIFETLLQGKTPGKWLMGLRVVRADGAPGRMPDFVLRNLLRAVDLLPTAYAVGVIAMFLDARMRRIGDLVAGTVVVREGRSEVLAAVEIQPPVTEAERRSLPAGVSLSQEELAVIESFLRRRPRLSDGKAEELATHFGPALSLRTGIEAATWERVITLAYARATGRDREDG